MSGSVRTTNLFSAEDYKKVFKSYQYIDYTAYDFDTLKQAMVNYIQTYYPEDFNDYIESSEFVAIIELLAYLGTSLAFRTDLNSRENFIDTAERRESIIRLAQMVNYVPRRNISASGLFKIAAVQTDQPLVDANGVAISNTAVFWNDSNNNNWFDQFVQICNAGFNTLNPFGRPTKSGSIGSIPTDLYQLNNVRNLSVTYPTTVSITGQQYPIDICNPDFVTNQTIFERDPDPANAFNFIYRNDSLGVSSANTGFFLFFKQGTLMNVDANFEFPMPNRLFPIDIQNINQDDVYVQETDQSGNVINKWTKVPALSGENIIYNSIHFSQRNVFDVITGANDTVTIRFADGNFGNVPTGLFRTWVRTSANQAIIIRPDNARGLQLSIPYVGVDGQRYTMSVVFNLEQTIGNAAASETDEQIKLRAPEVFSTQSRMVNGSDYNVLPLVYGNQLLKVQALDRTYSGQSRYIDLNDPTGFHKDLTILGQDGALYRDDQNILQSLTSDAGNQGTIATTIIDTIQEMLRDKKASTFFYDEYLSQFEAKVQPLGYSMLDLASNPDHLYWKTAPTKFKNDTGYFGGDFASADYTLLINSLPSNPWGFIKDGAAVEFAGVDPTTHVWNGVSPKVSVPVIHVLQAGELLVLDPSAAYATVGSVELGAEVPDNNQAVKICPAFRSTLTSDERININARISAGMSFWMYYDLISDTWSTSTGMSVSPAYNSAFVYPVPSISSYASNWNTDSGGLVFVNITSVTLTTSVYDITARGRSYVFESYKDTRFYWEPNQIVVDSTTGQALQDIIQIMPYVNTNNTVDNNIDSVITPSTAFLSTAVNFNITDIFLQDDGYVDSSKVEVSLIDNNSDGIADDPTGFDKIVGADSRVVFEYYTNEVTGYQSTRPWIARWNMEFVPADPLIPPFTGTMTVDFPFAPSSTNISDSGPSITTSSGVVPPVVYLDNYDLILIPIISQLDNIADALNDFFYHSPMTNKLYIVNNSFISKTFLINGAEPGYGEFYTFEFAYNPDTGTYPSGKITKVKDTRYYDKNGKIFTQNMLAVNQLPLYYKWNHYAPIDQRIDPAATNIIDMIAITNSYYRDMLIWKNVAGSLSTLPTAPTTEELRIQFQDLEQYKMVSDSMIWNSGEFKILFGPQAATELQCTFKVVKSPSTSVSDNEIKTRVVDAIDAYFDIRNWDFGEKFFYTELAAFIHQQLSRLISSVVIVPSNAGSQFGNLFEIAASANQLFMSTATVNNVQLISNLTNANLRV
jgi:hypothetical protein